MSLNSGSESTSWNESEKPANSNQAPGASGTMAPLDGLAGLLRLPSMTSDNRNLKEVSETIEKLEAIYENAKKSTTNELQRKIVPTVEMLTPSISAQLPGVGLYVVFDGTMYVMAALFYNRTLSIGVERITVNTNNIVQQMSAPLTPAQYPNSIFLEKLTAHYTKVAESKGVKNVSVINMIVCDLEMLHHPEAGDPKDYAHRQANYIASEWEEAIMVKTVREIVAKGYQVPVPFATPDQPYGKDGCAEARVNAISFRTSKAGTLTPDNMEVIVSTINNNNQNTGNFQANSKELIRVTAAVSLNGVSWEDHQRFMMSHRSQEQMNALQQFLGNSMGMGVYPQGFKPLRPVITVGTVQAGEQLCNNGGLFPFFSGLYALMSTNNQYVWSEALRRHTVGARGNLADLETRVDQMVSQIPGGFQNPQRIRLDEKKMSDTELVNNWIRQNVSPHATFQINLIPAGPNASINNFFFQLAKVGQNAAEIKVVIALIDSMTKGAFSEVIRGNVTSQQGWVPSKAVLIPTGMIAVNGLAEYAGKKFNTQELDEMMISHIKGPKGQLAAESLLSTMYGTIPGEEFKQRAQKLRVETSSSLFDGQVHINGWAQPHIWAPDFMAAMSKAMDSIGQLNVANNLGSWRNTSLASTPGIGLATLVGAGSNNPTGNGLGVAYNMNMPFM